MRFLLDDFLWLAIVVWVCLLVTTLGDLFARTDLCFWKKAVWAVAILTVPMGTFAYMALQNRAITDRRAARLLRSGRDPQPGSTSDEIVEMDRLVPMIQHAIEIKGILEAEGPTDQNGLCNETAGSEPVYAREPRRSSPGNGDRQGSPAVAA